MGVTTETVQWNNPSEKVLTYVYRMTRRDPKEQIGWDYPIPVGLRQAVDKELAAYVRRNFDAAINIGTQRDIHEWHVRLSRDFTPEFNASCLRFFEIEKTAEADRLARYTSLPMKGKPAVEKRREEARVKRLAAAALQTTNETAS